MKLSDIHQDDIKVESVPKRQKLSDFHPNDIAEEIPSELEATARGGAQGLSANWAPSAEAAVRHYLMNKKGSYQDARKEALSRYQAAENAHPNYYHAAEVAGGVAPLLIPGVGAAFKAAPVLASAGLGALQGLGGSDNEDLAGQAIDTAKGAGIGAAIGLGGKILGGVMGGGAKRIANERSAAALGNERGTSGYFGHDKIQSVGDYGLRNKIVTASSDTKDMIKKNIAINEKAGPRISEIADYLDSKNQRHFNPSETSGKMIDQLGDFQNNPLNAPRSKRLDKLVESVNMLNQNGENIPLLEPRRLKTDLGHIANWDRRKQSINADMMKQAYGIVKSDINSAVEKGANAIGEPNLSPEFLRANSDYENSLIADKLLNNRYNRSIGNKMGTGLTDTIMGTGALMTHGPLKALEMLGAKKAFERYGNQVMATGMDKLATGLSHLPNATGAVMPGLVSGVSRGSQALINSPSQSSGDGVPIAKLQGTPYEAQMQQAMQQDPQKAAILHYMLSSNDPNYAKLIYEGAND